MNSKMFVWVRSFGTRLTSLEEQTIGKAALTVLLFLDLFILVSIFQGLADHTAQLESPNELIPPICKEVIIEKQWVSDSRLLRTAELVAKYHGTYFQLNTDQNEVHPICQSLVSALWAIKRNKPLAIELSDLIELREQNHERKFELERIKGVYDTALLARIAQESDEQSREALAMSVAEKTEAMNVSLNQQAQLLNSLHQRTEIESFFKVIDSLPKSSSENLLAELRKLNFWYPVKRLGMEMIFLLPMFAVFFFWNLHSVSRDRPFQTLVSAHLMVIVFIPVIFKVIELIYDILPRKILDQIFEVLTSFNLVAVWYYFLMAFSILLAMAVIYLFQKKLFSQEKLLSKRIAKQLCQNCGIGLASRTPACPDCGFLQYQACISCDKLTYVKGKHCAECGVVQK